MSHKSAEPEARFKERQLHHYSAGFDKYFKEHLSGKSKLLEMLLQEPRTFRWSSAPKVVDIEGNQINLRGLYKPTVMIIDDDVADGVDELFADVDVEGFDSRDYGLRDKLVLCGTGL